MKNALIRITMMAVIATSASTFAVSENAKGANNKDSDYTNTQQAAVPSPVHQQNSDQDCQPIAGNNGFDDLIQQIRELRREVRQLRDDEKKARKEMQQQL